MTSEPRDQLVEEYAAALAGYLAGAGEAALHQAYELGRRALTDGLGVLEMAGLHHQALESVVRPASAPEEAARMVRAATNFLAQSLSPFEMTHRGFREANAELRASEERYRELFENANDVVFTTDLKGNFTSVNRAGELLTGYRRAETSSMSLAQVIASECLDLAREMLQRKLAGQERTIYEMDIIAKDGRRVPLEISTRLLYQDGKPVGVHGIARDITERKQAQEALHHLNELLEERAKQIAHALHDEAGQVLVAVYLAVAEVARELPAPSRQRLAGIWQLLDQVHEQLRRLSHELRPTILDDLGLGPALEFLAEGISKRTGLSVTVDGTTAERFPPAIETTLYRSVQEALTNVTKHARATRVWVELGAAGGAVCCVVRDNGLGFDVPAVLARRGERGLGLLGIRERLGGVGGVLEMASAPGRGTEMRMTIPLKP